MRIGIILINWNLGGSEKRFANLYNYLKKHGRNDYALLINHDLEKLLQEAGIYLDHKSLQHVLDSRWGRVFDRPHWNSRKIFGFKIPGFNFISSKLFEKINAAVLAFEKNLSGHHFDVIHFVFPYFGDQFSFPGGKVLSCQDTNLEKTLLRNKFFRRELLGEGFFDIASDRLKTILISKTGIQDDRRLRVNPCSFIDYSRTSISNKEPIVAFVGNFLAIKNPMLFVEVIEQVHKQYPDFRAVMYGKGVLEAGVRRMVSAKGLEDVIEIGFRARPEQLLSRSLVFMSIQGEDNYHSQALMEAMACGCAIVASDVGETHRLVSDNVGFRSPLDIKALSEKVSWLLKHPVLAAEMGKEARRKVMSEQTVERFGAYIESLYEDAA